MARRLRRERQLPLVHPRAEALDYGLVCHAGSLISASSSRGR